MQNMGHDELAEKYLKHLVIDGAHDRYGDKIPQDVYDRLDIEYDVIVPNHFVDYILMIWDIHDFCRKPERVIPFCKMKGITPPPDGIIPMGPGRGSAGGSMVCYCIGITQCDPLLFGLFFERFLNPERIAFPDIDFDISQKYRHIGLAYIADTYGEAHVAQIITYGTLSKLTVVHDVLASANVPNSIINEVKATIPDDPAITLQDVKDSDKFLIALKNIPFPDATVTVDRTNVQRILENGSYKRQTDNDMIIHQQLMSVYMGAVPSVQIEIKSSWTWQRALDIMLRLEGLNKHESTHAAGVVVAPVELESNVPLMRAKGDGVLACQYDMRSLEAIGYLKMDALGLRTVDVNHNAGNLVRKWYDPDHDISKIPYNDPEAIKLINDGDTIGIFQIESTGFTQMMEDLDIGGYEIQRFKERKEEILTTIERMRGLEINDFMWISAGLALYRPGPLDAIIEGKTMVQHLIDRKLGKEPIVYLFPEEKSYLEETYGVLVYQEQVMARVRQMTGCSYGRADILRKAMGKKDAVLMEEQMNWFIESAMNYSFSSSQMFDDPNHKKRIIDRAADEIDKFARYGFNKAHTVEYGHICYYNAYYKAHYPDCFYAEMLNSLTDKPERQTIIIRDMMNHGVELIPPDINESDMDFIMADKNVVRFGLAAIKQFGDKALIAVVEDKADRGVYGCVEEFRLRISSTLLNKTVMENLAKCGAFDSLLQNNASDTDFGNRASLVATMPDLCEALGKLKRKKNKTTEAPTVDEALSKWEAGAGTYKVTTVEEDPIEYSIWEKEILKYYISAHPIDAYVDEIRRWSAIQNIDDEALPNEFYIAGFIESCHETVIKKEGRNKGKKMGFVMVGTAYRTYEATMFPGIYESCLPYIVKDNPVVLKGKRDNYKGKVTIQCEYIRSMANQGIRDCPECHIRMSNPDDIFSLMQLKGIFDQHYGNTKVFIHVRDGYNDITIECAQTIALNDYIIDFVESVGTLAYKEVGI
jgi:DNA polymerase-3 subunit alpha